MAVYRPSRFIKYPSSLALVRTTRRSLQSHVDRHVPNFGCIMVNAATLVGRDDDRKRCGDSMEGIAAQSYEPDSIS